MPQSIIEITKHARLVVGQEASPRNPRVAGECITGTYTPPSWWGHRVEGPPPLFDHPGNIVEADDRLYAADSLEPDHLIQRWSRAIHGVELKRFGATYWYCDATMFDSIYGGPFTFDIQRQVIDWEHDHYEEYLRGDSRFITFQRLAQFKRVTKKYHDKQEDLLEVWEDVASIGDTYLDDNYQPTDVAFEYFYSDMTRREKTILTAMLDVQRTERALPIAQ